MSREKYIEKMNIVLFTFFFSNMHKKIGVLLTYVCLLLLVGCGAPKVIDNADNVEIAYTLRFTDATVYASGTNTFTI
jgi:hypothetical protein